MTLIDPATINALLLWGLLLGVPLVATLAKLGALTAAVRWLFRKATLS